MRQCTVVRGKVRFFLMTGREAVWNADFLLPEGQGEDRPLPEYVHRVRERLRLAYVVVP